MKRFIDSGILIAIFTAFLFTLSIANYNGYLSAMGVESSFIFRNTHQILYNSLFVILPSMLNVSLWVITASILLYPLAMLYTEIFRNWSWLKKKIARQRLKKRKLKNSRAVVISSKIIAYSIPIAIVVIVVIFSLAQSEKMGKESGLELIEKIKLKEYLPHEVVEIKGYESGIYIVSCGINNCAGVNVNNMKIEYFENKYPIGVVSNNVNITSR